MSGLNSNKQLILHVGCEIVVLSIIIFWVHKKTSNLWAQIEELTQRIEEQEENIQNHERVLKQLIEAFNKQRLPPPPLVSTASHSPAPSPSHATKPKKSVKINEEHVTEVKKEVKTEEDKSKNALDVLLASPLTDGPVMEDLDESIKEELAELEEEPEKN